MFGGVSTLLAWHPEWQKSAPKIEEQILAQQKEQQDRQEAKQDKMMETVEKAAERPATVISHVENYQPQIQNQNIDLPAPPFGTQETKRLDDE